MYLFEVGWVMGIAILLTVTTLKHVAGMAVIAARLLVYLDLNIIAPTLLPPPAKTPM